MKPVDLPFFLDLGSSFKEVENLTPESSLWDAFFPAMLLRSHINTLLAGRHVKMSAATHSGREFVNEVDAFESRYFRGEDGKWAPPENEKKNEWAIHALKEKAKDFKTILTAELRVAATFSVEARVYLT